MMIRFTQGVKGGKLKEKVRPRYMESECNHRSFTGMPGRLPLANNLSSYSSLRHRDHRQAAVPEGVERTDRENDVILGLRQGNPRLITCPLDMFPVGTGGPSPQNLVAGSSGGSLPG